MITSSSRCHRWKMMGRGVEGGCGTEEKPCSISISRVSSSRQHDDDDRNNVTHIDFYGQALKALSERSPFDVEDPAVASRVSTLPVGLADFLSRCSYSRKKQKKSHSESGAKSSGSGNVAQTGSNIWSKTEDYFRAVNFSDIENLVRQTSLRSSCFSIPSLPPRNFDGIFSSADAAAPSVSGGNDEVVVAAEVGCSELGVGAKGVEVEVKEEENEGNLMEIDGNEAEMLPREENEASVAASSPSPSNGLHWLLGVRNKILLTSERPSKKRKLLGTAAGLERLIVCPSGGNGGPVCHLCCLGDFEERVNKVLVCNSCNAAVHQKCYGVEEIPNGAWLCTWCGVIGTSQTESDDSKLASTPCLLCPKSGGALKPVGKHAAESENGPVKFAHLFCSQWMPEVYVEDTQKMEPILNIEGIKDTRKKLVCCLCKVKIGACVRCSHGTCRTAFHPICAREAKHRMEIWGKFGCDSVELRAFCAKHSDFQVVGAEQSTDHLSVVVGCDSSSSKQSPAVTLVVNKPQRLKLSRKNGDRNMTPVTTADDSTDKVGNNKVQEQDALATKLNIMLQPGSGDAQPLINIEASEKGKSRNMSHSDSIDIVDVLKKLIDRGKVTLSTVASEIGVSSEMLEGSFAGDRTSFFPDFRCKIIKWLRGHAYLGTTQPNSKMGNGSAIISKDRVAEAGIPDSVAVAGADGSDAVPVKSVPPRRRTKSTMRILKDNTVLCSSNKTSVQQNGDGIVIDEVDVRSLIPNGGLEGDNKSVIHDGNCFSEDTDGMEKSVANPSGCHNMDSSLGQSARPEAEIVHCNISENNQADDMDISLPSTLVNSDGERHGFSVDAVPPAIPDSVNKEFISSSYIHPFICKRLMQLQSRMSLKRENTIPDLYDSSETAQASPEVIFPASDECKDLHPTCMLDNEKLGELAKARKMAVLELSPEDELEGQLVYFQNKLLDCAVASKRYCDDLVFRIVRNLSLELEDASKQRWDSVLVNQYLCGLREAKKQGRKEKRHKEAQAVLAAATAAAASSSRISSLRKDSHDEAACHEYPLKMNAVSGRTGPYSQLIPRAKETLSRLAVGRASSERSSDVFQSNSKISKENPQSCEICRRTEALLNPILVCCNCKVAVHLDCYRSAKDLPGPWFCELCEEFSPSRSPGAPPCYSREKPCFVAQCSICAGTTGAFRRSTDGQWVHAFCAEWLLESTFRRGQPNLVQGMETMPREKDSCCICCRKLGICIKCNYGNCQSTFHPSCARNAGFYMHVKTVGSKLQHKAYCEKHSLEQREKTESLQHGAEELKGIKQIRVELERVRLLCERIIKREKVKRELVLCSHDILASKRDSVALSVLVRSPFFLPEVSSESATTSLNGHVDDNKSCSEAIQRANDITVDTAVSGKRRVMLPAPVVIDQKTDDSTTAQHTYTRKTTERVLCSGKKLPHRPASFASRNLTDVGEKKSKSRKHTETFQKELVMTSDQASLQNQRLPKGFAYVPVVCLPKEKSPTDETGSQEPVDPDG